MIDPADKQTASLPIETKRGRGRPATGKALSAAEKQRRYRERKAAQVEKVQMDAGGYRRALEKAWKDNEAMTARIIKLEAALLNLGVTLPE